MIKIILADDHRIFIEGLRTVLAQSAGSECRIVGVAHDGESLLRLLKEKSADLLILDLNLPRKDGIEITHWIHREAIPIRVLALTCYGEPRIVKSALKAGVDGYILKNKPVDELFTAIEALMGGHSYIGEGVGDPRAGKRRVHFQDRFIRKHSLTKREIEILQHITQALSNKEIAKKLFISDQTVSVHRKNIMRKLGVSSTASLIKMAYDQSLV